MLKTTTVYALEDSKGFLQLFSIISVVQKRGY